jgi:putative copper export protein
MARAYRKSKAWRFAQVAAVVLFVFYWASSGHSADASSFLGIRADVVLVVHVLAAGLWMGMIAVIFVTVLPVALRDTARLPLLRATVLSFSGAAAISAAVFVATGVINWSIYVGSISNLTGTLYGRTLLAKLALVALILGIGAYQWKSLRLRLHSVQDGLRLRAAMRLDLLLGALVLIITAVIVATTPAR